jgi:catechol 2,3-dioxygenase-like lactoylglutathione lyase family enzyme
MNLDHLALVVTDQERSRQFYERFFGFDQGKATHYEDGTLIIRNAAAFSLALHSVDTVPRFRSSHTSDSGSKMPRPSERCVEEQSGTD